MFVFGGFRGDDDIESKSSFELAGGEEIEGLLDDFGGLGVAEFSEGFESELFLGEGGFLAEKSVTEQLHGVLIGIELEEKFAGLAANAVALVFDEGLEGFLPGGLTLLERGEEFERGEAGGFGHAFGIEITSEVAGVEEEFFLFNESEREREELGVRLVVEGQKFRKEVSGERDSVRGESAGESGDEVGDGWFVPL